MINVQEKGKNKLVLLEIDQSKDNAQIIHWHYLDDRGLEKIKRQAENEDGQLLILPSVTEEAGALSSPESGSLSKSKGTNNIGVSNSLSRNFILAHIMTVKGISQCELAKRTGRSEAVITRWTTGFPNLTLKAISKLSVAIGEPLVVVPPME